MDAGAVAAGGHQTGPRQRPQVVGGVGDALVDLAGDLLDRSLALGEQIDDLGPPSAGPSALATSAKPSNSASLAARSPITTILAAGAGSVNPQTIT